MCSACSSCTPVGHILEMSSLINPCFPSLDIQPLPRNNLPLLLQRWAFLARFCFLSQDGTFSFEVQYNMRFATQRLLLYFDAPDQWPAVYGTTKVGGTLGAGLILGVVREVRKIVVAV